jgi:hypothetical protein
MKELVENAKRVAERKAGECEDCGGMGEVIPEPQAHEEDITRCPTCEKLREIANWCWHEPKYSDTSFIGCVHCGLVGNKITCNTQLQAHNPTFTVQTVRKLLEDLGEWEGFVVWVWEHTHLQLHLNFANILTSDELIAQSANAYLGGL